MTLPIRQQKETVTRYAANSQHTSYSQMQHETNGAAGTELIQLLFHTGIKGKSAWNTQAYVLMSFILDIPL